MPSNRRPVPAVEKRAEIITAARSQFVEFSYESAPISRIAKHAGVTTNTIYWYFEDKDDLLVSVLEEIFLENFKELEDIKSAPARDQLYWVIQKLKVFHRLVSTVHLRIQFSEKVKAWHDGFHAQINAALEKNLPPPSDQAARDAKLRIIAFGIEGIITHDLNQDEISKACDALTAMLRMLPD